MDLSLGALILRAESQTLRTEWPSTKLCRNSPLSPSSATIPRDLPARLSNHPLARTKSCFVAYLLVYPGLLRIMRPFGRTFLGETGFVDGTWFAIARDEQTSRGYWATRCRTRTSRSPRKSGTCWELKWVLGTPCGPTGR